MITIKTVFKAFKTAVKELKRIESIDDIKMVISNMTFNMNEDDKNGNDTNNN